MLLEYIVNLDRTRLLTRIIPMLCTLRTSITKGDTARAMAIINDIEAILRVF